MNLITSTDFPDAGVIVGILCVNSEGRTFVATGAFNEAGQVYTYVGQVGNNMYPLARGCRAISWFDIPDLGGEFDIGPAFPDVPF